jgi:processive 1,2-diacylglycerol beta-glucosyltransferase
MPASPRILIVTAAFGEGHNSAARNLALGLNAQGAVTRVGDPCMIGSPRLTKMVNWAYRYVITHFPQVWAAIYRSTDRNDFSKPSRLMEKPENALISLIDEFQPDVIVSTYPLYPYFLARIFEQTGKRVPVFTVITDSIEINASWLRAPTDFWLVTDPVTREGMIKAGLSPSKVIDTGFPVHPDFSKLQPIEPTDPCNPFHVLYFPTAKLPFIRRHSRALLNASPTVSLTIVLGRNVRLLHGRAREIQKEFPGRVRLIGWTSRVPRLLNRHHLVVGKAGGATVHEAIAARCPMLIHHLVPGQEEGNLKLLETIGAGRLAESPEALSTSLRDLLADHGASWRSMKTALIRHGRNAGAIAAAKIILNHLTNPQIPTSRS